MIPEIPVIYAAAARTFTWDASSELLGTDTLTGTPTITVSPSAGVTLSNKTVNASIITIDTTSVAIGEGVQWKGTGWTAGTLYEFSLSCGTVAGETIVEKARLQVI